jgi:hypothetical protein
VTIGQPISRSVALEATPVLTFAASKMVDRSFAFGCSSINALAGESNLIALAVFLYTEGVLSFIKHSVRLTLNYNYIVKS